MSGEFVYEYADSWANPSRVEAPNNQPQSQQVQQVQQHKPGVCTGLEHAGTWTVGLAGSVFIYGTLADTTVIGAPEGLLSQGSAVIGVTLGGIAIGVGDAGKFFGLCH